MPLITAEIMIKFGENDTLSAMVASLVQAQYLVILSTAPGLIDLKGTGKVVPVVEKITPEQRFGLDMPSARPEEWDEPLRPSPLMRRLGYTAHPATCTHYRKRLYLGTTQWTCAACGERL